MNDDPDSAVRAKAFDAIEHLAVQASGQIRWEDIVRGFVADGQTVRFANRALGIFRPRQMSAALSIKTVVPRTGRVSRYRDQSIDLDDPTGLLHYDLARGGLKNQTNRDLYQAYVRRAPLIYFRGRAPAVYEALWPVWVEEFSEADERVLISAHDTVNASVSSVMASGSAEQLQVEATYSLRVSRQRNHQAWFSSRTKSAYGYRCALSGLPLRNLLVGAHILPDAQGGPASVTNGICMSTLHHTAFDTNLIGIDPDFRVHVASPDIASRAAMIAQDFARVSVLGAFGRGARGDTPRKKRDGSIAAPYGVATMCAHAGKRPARARPAQFAPERISEKSY